ncbi:hypothetical protein ACINK0_18990 (plasmid) [Deinococcus sp. VB343]|uniref:hypothetical protein n=1 Tax=Deinococcus sp. VB343 TaxID=3385567 RepID=UPI0039C99669
MTNPPPISDFVGRQAEGRAVLLAVQAGRSVVLSAPTQYGKSALIDELQPALEELTVTVQTPKLAPFGQWLNDLFLVLRAVKIPVPGVTYTKSQDDDLKAWRKAYLGNETRARSLVDALRDHRARASAVCILIDDAGGITASMVPWLVALAEVAALVFCLPPETLEKSQLRRIWQKCDRVELPPLSPKESGELVDVLTQRYGIVAQDPRAYRARVLSLAAGVPGEIDRLVRFVSTETLVTNRHMGTSLAQQVVRREERGIALAPILLVFGAFAMITKYVGLARGEMDVYLIGGIGIALFMVSGPFLRKLVQTR